MISACLFALALAAAPAAVDAVVPSADGVPIHYHAEGQGQPALVFVHGWSCDRHYWDAQLPHFAAHHRVVSLDLAGHGESGRGRKAWTIPAFAADVRAVADALHLDHMVLVGHSMGGPVILEAALGMPGRVAALVPVDIFSDVDRKLTPKQRDDFLGALRSDFPKIAREFVTEGLFLPTSDPALVARVATAMAAAPADIAIAAMAGIWDYDSTAALRRTRTPIRCINSDRRPSVVEAGRRYAPQFDIVLMKGLGHFLMLEDPDGFNRLLARTVEELLAAPPAPK